MCALHTGNKWSVFEICWSSRLGCFSKVNKQSFGSLFVVCRSGSRLKSEYKLESRLILNNAWNLYKICAYTCWIGKSLNGKRILKIYTFPLVFFPLLGLFLSHLSSFPTVFFPLLGLFLSHLSPFPLVCILPSFRPLSFLSFFFPSCILLFTYRLLLPFLPSPHFLVSHLSIIYKNNHFTFSCSVNFLKESEEQLEEESANRRKS